MRKSTLFISAVLTTFVLAVLYGVVSAYQSIVKSTELAAVQPKPTAAAEVISQPMAVVPPTQVIPTQPANLTPEAAADIASKVLGRTDLYSVEVTQLDGVDVYLVTFSSGDIVYVSLDGQVLSISKLAVTVVARSTGGGGGGGGNGGGGSGGGEHEDKDDHEEHEGGDDD
jgi:hypothetical protein